VSTLLAATFLVYCMSAVIQSFICRPKLYR